MGIAGFCLGDKTVGDHRPFFTSRFAIEGNQAKRRTVHDRVTPEHWPPICEIIEMGFGRWKKQIKSAAGLWLTNAGKGPDGFGPVPVRPRPRRRNRFDRIHLRH